MEKMCSIQLKDGEVPQFNKSLRFIPTRGRSDSNGQRRPDLGRAGIWRPSLSGGVVILVVRVGNGAPMELAAMARHGNAVATMKEK